MEVPVEHQPVRQLLPSMRWLLLAAGVLVTLAGVQLFLFPVRTDEWFAWTIDPPMTAVLLGGAYWSSAAFEWTGARARTWADARVAVPTVFVFTTVTLVVTLVHLDRFHLEAGLALPTRLVTWTWIAVFATVPVLMGIIWIAQVRAPGVDPARSRPLGGGLLAVVAVQAVLFLVVGAVLLVAPERATWWPWPLTPLTGRALGAWVLSLGVAAGHAVLERDAVRLRPAAAADLAFAGLQGLALVRHGGDVDWGTPASWALVAVLVVMAGVGLRTLATARRRRAGPDAALDPSA